MPQSPDELLESIPKLVDAKDGEALAGLRDHPDKAVRKAVRKAIHKLRTAGVEVPEHAPRSWTTDNIVQRLRGEQTPVAMIDTHGMPGATRIMVSLPDPREGALLLVAVLAPGERVLDFMAYRQTDGQRSRLARDWERIAGERTVPAEWACRRLSWARAQTMRDGFSAPRAMDDALPHLGEAPDERPASFVGDVLKVPKTKSTDPELAESLLLECGVPLWPPVMPLEPMVQRVAEKHGGEQPSEDEAQRLKIVREAADGDEQVQKGLQGNVAGLLEDAAISLWIEGKPELAVGAMQMAAELRTAKAPEKVEWTAKLLTFQVGSLVRAMSNQPGQGQDQDQDQDRA